MCLMCNKSNFQVECHNIFLLSSVPSSSLFIKTHYRLCIYTVPFLLLCMIHSQWYIFIHINLVNICIFTIIISIPDTISYSLAYYYTDWMCPCAFSIFLTHHVYMYITPLLSILLFPQLSLYFLLTLIVHITSSELPTCWSIRCMHWLCRQVECQM